MTLTQIFQIILEIYQDLYQYRYTDMGNFLSTTLFVFYIYRCDRLISLDEFKSIT